jgi:hypothetical protein
MAEERQFHSIEEIRSYIQEEVERQLALQQKKVERWRSAKKCTWLALLAAGFVQYYLINIMYETLTLPNSGVNIQMAKHQPRVRT